MNSSELRLKVTNNGGSKLAAGSVLCECVLFLLSAMGDQSFMPAAQDPFISFCFNLFCFGMQFDLQIKKSCSRSQIDMHQTAAI